MFNKTPVSRIFDEEGEFIGDRDPTGEGFNLFGANAEVMEIAFEGCNPNEGLCKGDPSYDQAVAFGDCYDDEGDRLIAIMKNVIKNKGTFKP